MALCWVITGGGTGGHVTMALALGEAITEKGDRVLFIGSDQGLEAQLVPENGFELVTLPSRQVMGRRLLGRAAGALAILRASQLARRQLARVGADFVISVGGYAAMPGVIAAVLRRTPLALLEPNAIPGRVNRLTARFAACVFLGFAAAADRIKTRAPGRDSQERVRCLGIPLRRSLVAAFHSAGPRRSTDVPSRVLIFGGSQGAHQINEAMIEAIPRLANRPIEIFHQTGEADRERVAAAYRKSSLRAEVVAFEPDMPARYRWADIALCRAGAITVAELALSGLPALLVPYPYAADAHQAANARELELAGAARCLDNQSLDGECVATALLGLLDTPEELAAMSAAAAKLARPDAAARIVHECSDLLAARRARAQT